MTEEYKLPVFFKYNEAKIKGGGSSSAPKSVLDKEPHHTLKLVFVCEDSNPRCLDHLDRLSDAVFRDLTTEKLVEFMEKSEKKMFEKVDLQDTQAVIIANHNKD